MYLYNINKIFYITAAITYHLVIIQITGYVIFTSYIKFNFFFTYPINISFHKKNKVNFNQYYKNIFY